MGFCTPLFAMESCTSRHASWKWPRAGSGRAYRVGGPHATRHRTGGPGRRSPASEPFGKSLPEKAKQTEPTATKTASRYHQTSRGSRFAVGRGRGNPGNSERADGGGLYRPAQQPPRRHRYCPHRLRPPPPDHPSPLARHPPPAQPRHTRPSPPPPLSRCQARAPFLSRRQPPLPPGPRPPRNPTPPTGPPPSARCWRRR